MDLKLQAVIFKTKIMCIFFCGALLARYIANWFSILNASFSCGLKYFTEAFLFFLYGRKNQVQEQSGGKLWFHERLIIYTGN